MGFPSSGVFAPHSLPLRLVIFQSAGRLAGFEEEVEVGDGFAQAFFQGHFGFPAQFFPSQGDIRLAALGVILRLDDGGGCSQHH